jgi:hypothetical protein
VRAEQWCAGVAVVAVVLAWDAHQRAGRDRLEASADGEGGLSRRRVHKRVAQAEPPGEPYGRGLGSVRRADEEALGTAFHGGAGQLTGAKFAAEHAAVFVHDDVGARRRLVADPHRRGQPRDPSADDRYALPHALDPVRRRGEPDIRIRIS